MPAEPPVVPLWHVHFHPPSTTGLYPACYHSEDVMEFDLCSGILLRSGTYNALVAPEEPATRVLAGRDSICLWAVSREEPGVHLIVNGCTR
jgi:hypothetical protein